MKPSIRILGPGGMCVAEFSNCKVEIIDGLIKITRNPPNAALGEHYNPDIMVAQFALGSSVIGWSSGQ